VRSEQDQDPLPSHDVHISQEQAQKQAQDIDPPTHTQQAPPQRRSQLTQAHPHDLIIGSPTRVL